MATIADTARPERAALTLQVGVTGHRALPDLDPAVLHAVAGGLFRALAAAAARLHDLDQASADPVFTASPPVLRCLSGLAAGADTIVAEAAVAEGWQLVAALPFARAEFEHDFTADAVPRFRALLAQAATVSELDGARGRGGEPYADVGQQIVEQSDVLLAVWDGMPPRGPGGTGDVVGQAIERGIPVAVIPPRDPAIAVWQCEAAGGDVAAIVAAAMLPPVDASGFPQAFYRESLAPARWAETAVRWFERAMMLGARLPATPATPPPAGTKPQADAAFDVADRLAGRYAARFRAAGLMRYGLVLPATLGSFIGNFGTGLLQPLGFVLQFGSLVAVLAFSARGSWSRDQLRFIAYRALAEYLRNARLLAPLGAMVTPPRAPVHREHVADWAGWYGRNVLRQAGLAGGRGGAEAVASATQALRAATAAEIGFLLRRAAQYTAVAGRLRRIGVVLTCCGFGFVAVKGAMVAIGAGERATEMFNELALVVPALAPVFLGLLGFGEYTRLSTRYTAVAAELQSALRALDRAAPRRGAVLPVARRIAEAMLAEGADWQLLIRAHTMSAF